MLETQATTPEFTEAKEQRDTLCRQIGHLYSKNPDWVTFYREVLGVNGAIRRNYQTPQALAEFEKTAEYQEIQKLVTKLREGSQATSPDDEPTRVITVRMPKSLHEALRVEAHEHHTSMNKLCISKLLQMIDDGLVPSQV